MISLAQLTKLLIILLYIFIDGGLTERLGDLMYQSIIGQSACFRRLNGTHQMGCTSPYSGSVGVVHMVESEADAWWIVENGTAPPYTAVMSVNIFSKRIANHFIENPSSIAGVVLYYESNNTKPHWYSLESPCPNEFSSAPGSTCSSANPSSSWNGHAMDLISRDIPFPIFYVPPHKSDDVEAIIKCFKQFNSFDLSLQYQRALCALELKSFMFAAGNSEICHRRTNLVTNINSVRFCDPLADRNIYSSIFPRTENATDKSVFLLTARLDSASAIDALAPGAASTVAGLAIFMSAAKLLTDMIPPQDKNKYSKNVIFALFNGESFDYIGSQRVAYDMLNGDWPPLPSAPLRDTAVSLHVEIGQIGGSILERSPNGFPMRVFVPRSSAVVSDVPAQFIQSLTSEATKLNVSIESLSTDNLPPSSLHSFRRVRKDGRPNAMPALLLTDHGEMGFNNRYYHSVLDDVDNLNYAYHNKTDWLHQKYVGPNDFRDVATAISDGSFEADSTQVRLANVSTAIARAVYKHVTGSEYSGDLAGVSPQLIDEILFCYLVSVQCPLFAAALPPLKYSDEDSNPDVKEPEIWANFIWPNSKELPPPAPLYVGVSAWLSASTTGTAHAMALLTGERMPSLNSSVLCNRGNNTNDEYYNYYWVSGWSGTGECYRSTVNYSLAMSPAFTESGYDFTSNEFSTWTESVWQSVNARIFVIPNGWESKIAAILGAAVTLLTLAVSIWLRRHAAVLFGEVKSEGDQADGQPRAVQC